MYPLIAYQRYSIHPLVIHIKVEHPGFINIKSINDIIIYLDHHKLSNIQLQSKDIIDDLICAHEVLFCGIRII